MNGPLGVDPAQWSCGPATTAVRQILTEWAAIDWFEPAHTKANDDATSSFEEHHHRARAQQPELFAEHLDITVQQGGWPEFIALCERVRTQQWDWKFAALKLLSYWHSDAHGWSLSAEAGVRDVELLARGYAPGPGDLFFRYGEIVIWNDLGPILNLQGLDPIHAANANWYLSYARMDMIECIEWQLAEPGGHLDANPFLPLLRCYAAQHYPFSLAPGEVVLFGFMH
jgi:hypothetical protein